MLDLHIACTRAVVDLMTYFTLFPNSRRLRMLYRQMDVGFIADVPEWLAMTNASVMVYCLGHIFCIK
jgi:hypothetical protein